MFGKHIKQQSGATLIEMVIYISVISVILTGIVSITLQLIQLKTRADTYGILSSEATNIFEHIARDVKDCDSFSVTDSTKVEIVKDGVTKEYRFEDSRVIIYEGLSSTPITSNLATVTDLIFIDWTSTNSDNLIHIEIELSRGGINERFQTSMHKR